MNNSLKKYWNELIVISKMPRVKIFKNRISHTFSFSERTHLDVVTRTVLCINWSLYTVLALTCQLGHVSKMLETQWPGVRGTCSMGQYVQGQVQVSCSSPSDKCPWGRHWTDAESRRHSSFGDLATAACFLLLSVMYFSKIRLSVTNPRTQIVVLYRPSGVTKMLGRWPFTISSHDTTSFSPDSISWSVYYYLLSSDF